MFVAKIQIPNTPNVARLLLRGHLRNGPPIHKNSSMSVYIWWFKYALGPQTTESRCTHLLQAPTLLLLVYLEAWRGRDWGMYVTMALGIDLLLKYLDPPESQAVRFCSAYDPQTSWTPKGPPFYTTSMPKQTPDRL